ncbi:helix-turn-helix domain-containing protein [Streptomyces californicus]|uniref:helix-turn-helix domain-containing protein n=1 Tax=Streptomyces californicus TaxID=67351 RepID=UPI0038002B5F
MSTLLTDGGSGYLTTAEVAARYRTAASTVRYWRHIGYGPKGVKVGRRILYSPAEIARFERALADEQTEKSA